MKVLAIRAKTFIQISSFSNRGGGAQEVGLEGGGAQGVGLERGGAQDPVVFFLGPF